MITIKIYSQSFSFKDAFDCYNFIKTDFLKRHFAFLFQKYSQVVLKLTSPTKYLTYILIDKKIGTVVQTSFIDSSNPTRSYNLEIKPHSILEVFNNNILSYKFIDYYVLYSLNQDIIYEFIPYDARYRLYYKFIERKYFNRKMIKKRL